MQHFVLLRWNRGENKKSKSVRAHGLVRWRQLTWWSKSCIHKQSTTSNSFTRNSHQQAGVQLLLGKRSSSWVMVSLEDKYHHSECHLPHFLLLYCSFCCWAWCHMVWTASWVSLGPGCVLSQLFVHPQPARWQGSMRSRKILGSAYVPLGNNKNICVLSPLFSSKIQNHIIQASTKKINSISDETMTKDWNSLASNTISFSFWVPFILLFILGQEMPHVGCFCVKNQGERNKRLQNNLLVAGQDDRVT